MIDLLKYPNFIFALDETYKNFKIQPVMSAPALINNKILVKYNRTVFMSDRRNNKKRGSDIVIGKLLQYDKFSKVQAYLNFMAYYGVDRHNIVNTSISELSIEKVQIIKYSSFIALSEYDYKILGEVDAALFKVDKKSEIGSKILRNRHNRIDAVGYKSLIRVEE